MGNTSTTDVRKSGSTADLSKHKRSGMTRRQPPSGSQKPGRSHRERHEVWDHDERESFPQYWYVTSMKYPTTGCLCSGGQPLVSNMLFSQYDMRETICPP